MAHGTTHGLMLIFWILQSQWMIPLIVFSLGYVTNHVLWSVPVGWPYLGPHVEHHRRFLAQHLGAYVQWWTLLASCIIVPALLALTAATLLVIGSRKDAGPADWEPYLHFHDKRIANRWRGQKIPIEHVVEGYLAGKIDFLLDVYQIFLLRNRLFSFRLVRTYMQEKPQAISKLGLVPRFTGVAQTWGHLKFYFLTFLGQNVGHSESHDHSEIAHVYDRGNDFYNWFLGPTMVYTSGIFRDRNETLEVAQHRKLDMVCHTTQMKPGHRHLDIGCGWGTLAVHAALKYGTHSTGITLAKEQVAWGTEVARRQGVSDRVELKVMDYRLLPPDQKYDRITCLEMAEHVGIKNFQKFLRQVRDLLADDGIFYLQIAGLRRPWQYEDLVWGLFMGKYIFPAADASCPLGFDVNQLEQAGFEVHRVENCGVHYSLTIHRWYENWKSNVDKVIAKYGQFWYRLWMVFLAWSTLIAAQGSSTVWMITATKNHKNDKRSVAGGEAPFSRMDHWVGPNPVATQQ